MTVSTFNASNHVSAQRFADLHYTVYSSKPRFEEAWNFASEEAFLSEITRLETIIRELGLGSPMESFKVWSDNFEAELKAEEEAKIANEIEQAENDEWLYLEMIEDRLTRGQQVNF